MMTTTFTTTWTCPGCEKVTPIDVYDCVKDFEFMPDAGIFDNHANIVIKATHAVHIMDFIHEQHDCCARLIILAIDTNCFDLIVRILSNPASFVDTRDDPNGSPSTPH